MSRLASSTFRLLILTAGFYCAACVVNARTTVEVRISASSDDGEENSTTGAVDITSTDLNLPGSPEGHDTVGMRFAGVTIPDDVIIVDAYIQFQVDEVSTGSSTIYILGGDLDDAPTIATDPYFISSQPLTTAYVAWSPANWTTPGEAGAGQRTPNLAAIVQEIIDRPGWVSGNALGFGVTGSGRRTAESYDGDPAAAPLLHIEHTTKYYVRPDGNDANSGTGPTAGEAWRTLNHAGASGLDAGDQVYVHAGTYNETITVNADGTSTLPIQFIADTAGEVAGWSPGPVVIQPAAGSRCIDVDNDDYLLFRGFSLAGNATADVIDVDACTGIVLERCDIYGGIRGVEIDQGASVTLTNCLVRDNDADGVRVLNGTVNCYHVTVVNNESDGIEIDIGTATVTNCIAAFNDSNGLDNAATMNHSYNLVYGNNAGNYSGTSASTGEISVDPLFVGDDDYRLPAESPAVDAGTNLAGVADDDLLGIARPHNAAWDMGCYEFTIDGHWLFDEGVGTVAADSSPTANDATLSGAVWTSDCGGNTALEFNGTGGVATTDAAFDPPDRGAVAFWMRSAGPRTTIGRLFGINGNWEARQDPEGYVSFDLGGSPNVGNEPFATAPIDDDGLWRHVVAQYDTAHDLYELYVDGELVASGITYYDLAPQSAGTLSFGTRTGSTEYWEGALRDFRIYPRWLSPAEVVRLSGMAGRWKLDETSGTVAADATLHGNDGVYQNGPTLGATSVYPAENGTAVLFDGVDDYVEIPHSDAMLADGGAVTFWFRTNDISANQGLFSKDSQGYDTGGHLTLRLTGGELEARLQSNTTSYTIQGPVVPGVRWTHAAASWGSGGLILFVNGRQVAANLSYTGGLGSTSGGTGNFEPIVLGASTQISGNLTATPLEDYLDGAMDDVRFYTRELCADEIYRIYRGSRSPGVRIMEWTEVR